MATEGMITMMRLPKAFPLYCKVFVLQMPASLQTLNCTTVGSVPSQTCGKSTKVSAPPELPGAGPQPEMMTVVFKRSSN